MAVPDDGDRPNVIITIRDYAVGSTAIAMAVRDEDLDGGSWPPIEKSIWKTGDKATGRRVFKRYSKNGKPVWIIAVTNNKADFNYTAKEAFQSLLNEDGHPSVGTWTDPDTGHAYNDTMFFFSGTGEEAEKIQKKYNQKAIIEVEGDGNTKYIE